MKIIENEQQGVEYFQKRFVDSGMNGWGSVGQWGEAKRTALQKAYDDLAFESLLDIGCGDLIYVSALQPFKNNEFRCSE
jgi:hypothetical protein